MNKLAYRQNQKRIPYGGHHFREDGVTFKGETFEQVVKQLEEFRIRNGKSVGLPDQDVLMFYAKNWPWLVNSVEGKETRPDSQYEATKDWVKMIWATPQTKHLTEKESSIRLEVCLKCPHNIPHAIPQNAEGKEIEKRLFLLRRALRKPEAIGFCDLHKADISVLSFIENAGVYSKKKEGRSPDDCWVK